MGLIANIRAKRRITYYLENGLYIDQRILTPKQWNDKELVLLAVKVKGVNLKYASDALKNDKDVVLAAIKSDGYALEYASDTLRGDKEIVLAAVCKNGTALQYASEDMRSDKEVVIAAMRNRVGANEWALGDAMNDPDVLAEERKLVLASLDQGRGLPWFLSDAILKDKEFVLTSIQNGISADTLFERMYMDEDIAKAAWKLYKKEPVTNAKDACERIIAWAEQIGFDVDDYDNDEGFKGLRSKQIFTVNDLLYTICLLTANLQILMEDQDALRQAIEAVSEALAGLGDEHLEIQGFADCRRIFTDIKGIIMEHYLGDDTCKVCKDDEKLADYVMGWYKELAALSYEYEGFASIKIYRGIVALLPYLPEDIAVPILLSECYRG